ncbi:sulfotransferase domain-containing protein [Alteromonas sp. 5E99-2]|uniref:sulfotransferase domain-containing protein n=1 Tax=Alteromonas sp. 5E99-2 TaxID=2817683 RepID=UPI001A981D3A|nr:sulfotransferase domain-containing protein [Alteromonas sp. 5E99-2]MBO1254244.1 sulfotransferase domain-containing protein [Alteromonas sp. 5E99-2]
MSINMNPKYLLISGSTKCGTTSLFDYLSQVDLVCPAARKETRFFLSEHYPLPRSFPYSKDISVYKKFFINVGASKAEVNLDATPDYMYCKAAMSRIAEDLNEFLIVLVLRDPVERFKSWYKFARQIGAISNDTSFNQFFDMQVLKPINSTPQHLRALAQGFYSSAINDFPTKCKENLLLVSFEELKRSPDSVVENIFSHLNINVNTNLIEYGVKNESVAVKNQSIHKRYLALRRYLNGKTAFFPFIHRIGKKCRIAFDKVYLSMNNEPDVYFEFDNATITELENIYADERDILLNMWVKKAEC